MSTCTTCEKHTAVPRGSGIYARDGLCAGCWLNWFAATTRAEDKIKAALAFQAPPDAPPAATPVWAHGLNVKLSEKPCDRCGVLIDMRKGKNGTHYAADADSHAPHWRTCKKGTTP